MEVYIDLSEDCQQFPAVGGRLNESIYGLVRGGRLWNLKLADNLEELGLEQSLSGPCVFRKVFYGEAEVIAVIHADDILVATKGADSMEICGGPKIEIQDKRSGRSRILYGLPTSY